MSSSNRPPPPDTPTHHLPTIQAKVLSIMNAAAEFHAQVQQLQSIASASTEQAVSAALTEAKSQLRDLSKTLRDVSAEVQAYENSYEVKRQKAEAEVKSATEKVEKLRARLNRREEMLGKERERDMEPKGRERPQCEESRLFVNDDPQDDDEFIKIEYK